MSGATLSAAAASASRSDRGISAAASSSLEYVLRVLAMS